MSDTDKAPASAHKFRYLLPPGNNFAFTKQFKAWVIFSILTMAASIGMLFVNKQVRGEYMNWTIDFKGGTEIIASFTEKSTGTYTKVDLAKTRAALEKVDSKIEISNLSWTATGKDGNEVPVTGVVIRTTRFSALTKEKADAVEADVAATFKDREISKVAWSGDRLNVRSKKPLSDVEMNTVLSKHGLEGKAWGTEEKTLYTRPDEGTGEYTAWFAIYGLDRQYEQLLEQTFEGVETNIVQSYGVGAKAGDKLRNDAIKSVIYAIFLIMLYLAFRFDIRYAPAAAFATIHDAVLVIGIFAVTYTEVSLVSVAGLLTVMGFSVNDTVIVFDRIRENQAKLKDKTLERIVNISLNEMLVRTILTSATVFSTTLIMNIFGTGLVKNFAFTMNAGIIVGIYSSMFLATPIFMAISKKWYSTSSARRRQIPSSSPAPSGPPDE